MNEVRDITVVATSVALLRAAAAGAAGDVALCQTETDLWQGYNYDAASTTADDGRYVVKPDSVGGGSPGRWILKATVEDAGNEYGFMVVSLPWNGVRAAVRLGPGWEVVSVDATKVYVVRSVEVT